MKKILKTLKVKWAEYLLEIFVIIIGIISAYMLTVGMKEERKEILNKKYLLNFMLRFKAILNVWMMP